MNSKVFGSRQAKAAVVVTGVWAFLWWFGAMVFASVAWLLFERNAPPPFPPMPLLAFLKMFSPLALAVGIVAGALFTSFLIWTRLGRRGEISDRTVIQTGTATGALAGLFVGFVGMSLGIIGSMFLLVFGACMGWLSATVSVENPHRAALGSTPRGAISQESGRSLADHDD